MKKLLLYNVGIFLSLFLLCEIGFRLSLPNYQYYQRTYHQLFYEKAQHLIDNKWIQRDTTLGWVCKSEVNIQFYNPTYAHIKYEINKQGFRNPFDLAPKESSLLKKRILLLGDSFMFGLFLEKNQTIASRLQKTLGPDYEVINLAVPAWGIDQMHDAYQKYVNLIQPDQVILFYIDEDILRVLDAFFWGATTKNAYKIELDEIVKRDLLDGKTNGFISAFIFNSKLLNYIYKGFCHHQALPITKKLLSNMIRKEQGEKRKLSVIRFPRKEQLLDTPSKYDLRSFFEKEDASFIDLKDIILQLSPEEQAQLYLPNDGHLSVEGARLASQIILQEILVY